MQTDKEFLDEKDFDFSEDYFEEEKPTIQTEEPYQKLAVEEKLSKKKPKVKYEGKKNVVSVQRKKTDKETSKKLISISEKNKKVLEILKNIKGYTSESDFICQAIIEKYERDTQGKTLDLKDSVRKVLEEMIGDNFIIMKSSSDLNVVNNYSPIQPQIYESEKPSNDEDNADLIRGVMDMWDED